MKKHNIIVILTGLLIMMAAVSACAKAQVNIVDAYMASDNSGETRVITYKPDQPFYAILEVENINPKSVVKADWYASKVENVPDNSPIDDWSSEAGKNNVFTFDLTSPNAWPFGTYRVDLYIDNVLKQSLSFTVAR